MKKIDLHIHTVSTISDRAFTYSLDSFKRYVSDAKLDVVAVTNHDVFDGTQFREIQQALGIIVFPGIEINLEKGHVLVIANSAKLEEFESKTAQVSKLITKIGDSITVEKLIEIFGDLHNYLVIPHYEKGPEIAGDTLEKLKPYVSAGEVDSAKKFVRNIKDPNKLTPVLFSDSRMRDDLGNLPTRQTFVDCGAVTLEALKSCLQDKAKVALSESDGNRLWEVFDNGQKLSTGLNVLIGARSTGKTYMLDRIKATIKSAKYIEQFSLVQQNDADYEKKFKTEIERRRSMVVDDYLAGLKRVIDDAVKIDLATDQRGAAEYIDTLLGKYDLESDVFSAIKLPVREVVNVDPERQAAFIVNELKQVTRARLQQGVGRFEALFGVVSLGGEIESVPRQAIFECSQVRNLIVHRNSIIDARFLKMCPWYKMNEGISLPLERNHFLIYYNAAFWYVLEIQKRLSKMDKVLLADSVGEIQKLFLTNLNGLVESRPSGV